MCKTPSKKRSDKAVRKKEPQNIVKEKPRAQNRNLVQSSTVKHAKQKAVKTGCTNLFLGQWPIPECTSGSEGECPGQIISPLQGRLTRRQSYSHIISSPPGLHVGGLWVENRHPEKTHTGRCRTCKLHTYSAVKV